MTRWVPARQVNICNGGLKLLLSFFKHIQALFAALLFGSRVMIFGFLQSLCALIICNDHTFWKFTCSFESQAIYICFNIIPNLACVIIWAHFGHDLGSGDRFSWQGCNWEISIILCACCRGKDFWTVWLPFTTWCN